MRLGLLESVTQLNSHALHHSVGFYYLVRFTERKAYGYFFGL
ncbi:hypothetical protein VCSRO100_0987 [Vibrio cholerae]|nr:hypothetical protein VCSRO100_0987 [Vibrio cholerae]